MTYTFSTGSGYLNSPPRVVMIDNDNRPGSYPSHASPIDIRRSQGSDGTRPYRDIVISAAVSPYAKATLRFITGLPTSGATITLTSTGATVSTFTFKANPTSFNPSPGAYEIDTAGIWVGSTDTSPTSIEAARLISLRFIDAVSRATGCLITAAPSPTPGEVFLTQTVPGSAGNTAISTTVSALRLEVENFAGGSDSADIRYPYGQVVIDSDPSTSEVIRRVLKSTRSGTLSAPGTPNPQMLIGPSDQHPYVNYSPFDESGTQQSFGLPGGSEAYGTQVQLYDEFFTRGSTLGPLDEPLWVKDKIEIDLTPVESTTIRTQNTVDNNYHMMYFNHASKKWERLGFGEYFLKGGPTLQQYLDRCYIGFGQFYDNLVTNLNDFSFYNYTFFDQAQRVEYERILSTGEASKYGIFTEASFGSATDTFGFPLHPKYHATSSQQIAAEGLIDRPFLVEKFVYEFSGSSSKPAGYPGASLRSATGQDKAYNAPAGTFFILNQRKANPDPGQENSYTNVYISHRDGAYDLTNTYLPPILDSSNSSSPPRSRIERYENGGIPSSRVLSPGGPSVYVDTVRDLVTFARIGCVWPTYKEEVEDYVLPGSTHPAKVLDLAIDVPASGVMNGVYTLAADIKSPVYHPAQNIHITKFGTTGGPSGIISFYAARDTSTRNALNVSTGRAYRAEFNSAEIDSATSNNPRNAPPTNNIITFTVGSDTTPSPYLLMPGDRLIFGWQAQISKRTHNTTDFDYVGYPLTIGPGAGKLTLYGSYLQDNKPVHNIYKDQLNSDAAHEAIPAGPWVLDRFESEPQMMYSCSMREEHVTGTMLTRNADGSLSVTPVNDLSIGGVRAVSARVSDGTVKQRWSFFRNNRLFDSDEQYYDSMQPNPLDVLFTYGGGDRRGFGTTAGAFALISIPGEVYVGDSTSPSYNADINSIKNTNFVGSFPFGKTYPNVPRVKSINSILLSSQRIVSLAIGGNTFKNLVGVGFLTGSAAGNRTLSNFVRDGGLFRYSPATLKNDADFIYVKTSRDDTNPVPGASRYLGQNIDSDGINYHLSRFMGCFGEGYMQLIQYGNLAPTYPTDRSINQMIYRGTKHGLINPTPLFTSAVFNGTQYGQFRDMMEQRQYTRFSLTDNTLTDAAVSVQFINRSSAPGTLNITSGSATNSSNVSQFATSEHPYDDGLVDAGQIWDRDEALPETLITL